MKCPGCNREGRCFYTEPKKTTKVNDKKVRTRVSKHARCRACGWEGEIL